MSILCRVEDKFVPLFRVMWVAATPHFCGDEDCTREGAYEVRLEQDESLWATGDERDNLVTKLEAWGAGEDPPADPEWH